MKLTNFNIATSEAAPTDTIYAIQPPPEDMVFQTAYDYWAWMARHSCVVRNAGREAAKGSK